MKSYAGCDKIQKDLGLSHSYIGAMTFSACWYCGKHYPPEPEDVIALG